MADSEEFYEMVFSTAKSAAAYAQSIKDSSNPNEKKRLEKEALSYVRASYEKICKDYPEQAKNEEEVQTLIEMCMRKNLGMGRD